MICPQPKTILIAGGSGGLGKFITKAFLERKEQHSVIVLSRKGAKLDESKKKAMEELKNKGARLVEVDYANPTELKKAMEGVDTVICAFGGMNFIEPQKLLIKAAMEAGVKHFCPSEFGMDTESAYAKNHVPVLAGKIEIQELLKKSGMNYTLFITGFFHDTFFTSMFGWDWTNGKINTIGDGNSKCSFTMREDVGKYVAEAVCTGKAGKKSMLAGETMTFNDAIAILEKAYGKKLDVKRRPAEEVKKSIEANKNDMMKTALDQLHLAGAIGEGEIKNADSAKMTAIKPCKLADWAPKAMKAGKCSN